MSYTEATYPLHRMWHELTNDDDGPFYPSDLEDHTEQQIKDLYSDYFAGY